MPNKFSDDQARESHASQSDLRTGMQSVEHLKLGAAGSLGGGLAGWTSVSADITREREYTASRSSSEASKEKSSDAVLAAAGKSFYDFEERYFSKIDENQDYHLSSSELKAFIEDGGENASATDIARFLLKNRDTMAKITSNYCVIHDEPDFFRSGISHRDLATAAKAMNPSLSIDPLTKISTATRLLCDGIAGGVFGAIGFVAGPWGAAFGAALGTGAGEVAYMATIGPYQWRRAHYYEQARSTMRGLVGELRDL
jgi:hypothetical protein